MVRILLFMFVVMGITVPMLFVRYIVPFPVLIGSLNVIVITLFGGMFTALFVGLIVFTVGDVPTTNLLLQNAMGFPAISVKLPMCKITVYRSSGRLLFGVMVRILLFMLVVIGITVPILFVSSIQPFPILIG